MNTKRIIFWACFIIILVLIVWGLIVAMNKPERTGPRLGTPPPVTDEDHAVGSSTAPITLIEYSDFQCPACAAYYPSVERLLREASTTVRFVYRHFPLYPLPHRNSMLASQASEAAAEQGEFWDMYRMLFDEQASWSELTEVQLRQVFADYASKLGLNTEQFTIDLNSKEVKDRVAVDKDQAEALGVISTPTFFANGEIVYTTQPTYEIFKAAIETAAQTRIP